MMEGKRKNKEKGREEEDRWSKKRKRGPWQGERVRACSALLFAGKFSKRNSRVSVDSLGSGHPRMRSSPDAIIPEHSHSEDVLTCYVWAAPLWACTFLFS